MLSQANQSGNAEEELPISEFDPEMSKMMDRYAQALIEKHYTQKLQQNMGEVLEAAEKAENNSYTMKKFLERNKESADVDKANLEGTMDYQNEAQEQQKDLDNSPIKPMSASEEFELTAGQTMPKREPEHVSSEEVDYNTEMEQAKELLRDELSGEDQARRHSEDVMKAESTNSSPTGSTEDESPSSK